MIVSSTQAESGRQPLERQGATPRPNAPPPARRKPLRLAAPAFLAALLALLAAGPAAAQRGSILVSNKAETPTASLTANQTVAQGFSTGSNSAGYTPISIDVKSNDAQGDAFSLALYTTDASDLPDTQSVALIPPGSFTAGVLTFTAPAGITLAASTDYSLVFTRGTGVTFLVLDSTTSDGDDSADTSAGWSIANTHSTLSGSTWSNATSGISLRVALRGTPKSAPVFNPTAVTREFAENTAAGENVGDPVAATDADTGDTLSYTLGGTDAASFDIVETSGQIQTKAGVTYDHEAKASYAVTVTASDGTATADATVTISVSDVNEPPLAVENFSGVPVAGSYTQMRILWSPPDNAGRPDITAYDVQYEDNNFDWTDAPQGDGTSTLVTGLLPGSINEIRIRAKNEEGNGPWSGEATGYTHWIPLELDTAEPFIPSGLVPGDSFRILLAGSESVQAPLPSASSGSFHDYNNSAQQTAAQGTDNPTAFGSRYVSLHLSFRPLVSLRRVNARDITNTVYTDDDKGVPIYWLRGSKVADDYEDFYDGDWDDETNARDQTGQPVSLSGGVWTGSDHDGTERFEGGVSRALGQSQAAYGVPGSTVAGAGPLYAGSTADVTEKRSLYALSYAFTIVAPGIVSNLLPALSARVNDDRSARRSQAFTTGPNLHGYDVTGVQIAYRDEEYDAISLALYSVDSNGHPDTEIAALTYPVAEAAEQSQTFALPAGTTLDPGTTYALVASPATSGTDVGLGASTSDAEDAETAAGWSVADAFDYESGGSWVADTDSKALRIRVRGTPKTGPPGKPTGLGATAMGRYQIDLSWTAPAMDGGSEITGYRIESSSDAGANWTDLVADTGTTATAYSHTPLPSGSTRHYRVSAINANGTSPASDTASATTAANIAPAFADPAATVSVNENTPAGQNIAGAGLRATDANGDTLTYSFLTTGGTDYQHFAIDSASGQVKTHGALDHEARSSYSVTVRATDPEGAVGAIAYTIEVTDQNEPPSAPGAPAVAARPGTDDRLDVSWNAPANAGKPAITSYDLHYRPGMSGNWIDGPQNVVVTSAVIPDLSPSTSYQVEVLATNADGDSDWSDHGTGSTSGPLNSAPTFVNPTVTLILLENSGGGVDIGSPVEATDTDLGDTLTYSLEGADASSFSIVTSSGQIRTLDGVIYDFEAAKNSYTVSVTVTDQTANASASVTINLIDAAERPVPPGSPAVAAKPGTDDSLDVSWTAPANAGKPAITSYDLHYRPGMSGNWIDGPQNVVVTSAVIPGLSPSTSYQVEVLATNADGDSDWSDHGTGSTGNSLSVITQVMGVRIVPGNAHLVVRWMAVDNVTGYKVQWKSGGFDYNTGDRQATVTSGSTRRYRIPNLTNGTEYTVRVIATRTGANDGPPSAEVTATPDVVAPRPPPPLLLRRTISRRRMRARSRAACGKARW